MPLTMLEKTLRRSDTPSLASLSSFSESSSRSLYDNSNHSSFSAKDLKETKRVSFSDIEVVELPMILGDHPACRDGLPVQTSWKHSDRYSVSVDFYEEARSPARRSGSELYISSFDRLKLIRNIPLTSSPMSCPPRIQNEDSKPWRADSNILESVAPPPMTLDEEKDDDIDESDDNNNSSSSENNKNGSEEEEGNSNNSSRSRTFKDRAEEMQRLERRLDYANSRFDELTSRLDDLDLIRKERIQRRRRRQRQVKMSLDREFETLSC